jgi:4-amino-4-deoxy-L-arabinose transferase-like glycosyltransferase
MEKIDPLSKSRNKADLALLAGLALFKVLLHLPVLTRYGFHSDELYFIACGKHLSFGYVDHAPLVPWLARLSTSLFGESLFALRILATLSTALTVFLAGLLVRKLGGGRFAQVLTCLGVIIAPVYLRTGNMLCLPAFEPLFWILASYMVVRIIQENNPRLWLWGGFLRGPRPAEQALHAIFCLWTGGGYVADPHAKTF